jgi:hypothetical protein
VHAPFEHERSAAQPWPQAPQLVGSREMSAQTPPHRERPTAQALPASGVGGDTDADADGTQNPLTQALAGPQSALLEHSSIELRPQPIPKPPTAAAAQTKAAVEEPARRRCGAFIEAHGNVTRRPSSAQMRVPSDSMPATSGARRCDRSRP